MYVEKILPPAYGFAVLDVALYSILLAWIGSQVIKARKTYNVPLPAAYENKEDSIFNRYQRAHANSLEGAPTFFVTLLLSALVTPILSSIAGFIFIIGRYLYCVGYYESVQNRSKGQIYGKCNMELLWKTDGCVRSALRNTNTRVQQFLPD